MSKEQERKHALAYWIMVEYAALKESKDNKFIFDTADSLLEHAVQLAKIAIEEAEKEAA